MGLRERMAKWSKNTAEKQNFLSKKIINKRISTIKDKTLQYLCKNDRIVLVHNLINNLYYVHMYIKQSVVPNSATLCYGRQPASSSVHGSLLTRILEWVAMLSSRGSSQPRDQTLESCDFCIGRQILYTAPPGKPMVNQLYFNLNK